MIKEVNKINLAEFRGKVIKKVSLAEDPEVKNYFSSSRLIISFEDGSELILIAMQGSGLEGITVQSPEKPA